TTKGRVDLFLSNYEPREHEVEWLDLEASDNGIYSAPLNTFNTLIFFSDNVVSGGSNGMTVDEVRSRLIDNSFGGAKVPITEYQLNGELSDRGYEAVRYVDNITKRIMLG